MDPTMGDELSRHEKLLKNPIGSVVLVGAGATGFWVGSALAGLGTGKVTVWDFDSIEPSNLNRQLYGRDNIGRNKATTLVNHMSKIAPLPDRQIFIPREREMNAFNVLPEELDAQFIVNATDNVYFHGLLWDKIKALAKFGKIKPGTIYISPRMSAFDHEIFVMKVGQDNPFAYFLTKDEWMEISKRRSGCTAGGPQFNSAIVTTSMVLGALVVQQMVNERNGEKVYKWYRSDLETGKVEAHELY